MCSQLLKEVLPEAVIVSDKFGQVLLTFGKVHRTLNSSRKLEDNEIVELGNYDFPYLKSTYLK